MHKHTHTGKRDIIIIIIIILIIITHTHTHTRRRDLITFPYGEEGRLVEFNPDGKTGLVLSTLGRETTALLTIDLQSGETKDVIASNDRCNVGRSHEISHMTCV